MGRSKRIHYGSACYHVCARGNNRRHIFEKTEAKKQFLSILERYQRRMGFKVYAYVIMGNHFHVLIEVHERWGISKVMQGILLSYSLWYRRREKYVGHVWQGRFKSRLIEDEGQLLQNISYIHASIYQTYNSSTIVSASTYLRSKNGLLTNSAGNDNVEMMISNPSSMITVSATDSNDYRASWSNYGEYIDVSALGVSVYSTTMGGGYAHVSGCEP